MYSQLNAAQRGKSERRVSGTYAHEGVRSDVAMRASGVLWGPCHNSRGPEPLWKRAEDHRHLTGLRTEAGMFLCNHHRKHDSAGNREERREKMLCVFVLPRCDMQMLMPNLRHPRHPPPSACEPQSTLRSLPQTSSAFFLPLVSGTYHERKTKKNAESAANIR
jgi:hypothetical protein